MPRPTKSESLRWRTQVWLFKKISQVIPLCSWGYKAVLQGETYFWKSYSVLREMVAYWQLITKEWIWKWVYRLPDFHAFLSAGLLIVVYSLGILHFCAAGDQAGRADEGMLLGEVGPRGLERTKPHPQRSGHPAFLCKCSSAGAGVWAFPKKLVTRIFYVKYPTLGMLATNSNYFKIPCSPMKVICWSNLVLWAAFQFN